MCTNKTTCLFPHLSKQFQVELVLQRKRSVYTRNGPKLLSHVLCYLDVFEEIFQLRLSPSKRVFERLSFADDLPAMFTRDHGTVLDLIHVEDAATPKIFEFLDLALEQCANSLRHDDDQGLRGA